MNTLYTPVTTGLRAEIQKLRHTLLLRLILFGGLVAALLIFCLFYFQAEPLTDSSRNPWIGYFDLSITIVSMLLAVPFAVLVSYGLVQSEHRANAWKLLYALPLPRSVTFLSKGALLLVALLFTYLSFFVATLAGGYLLGALRPEYGFAGQVPDVGLLLRQFAHSLLAVMGVAALQYWLALRFRNALVSLGIGLGALVAGPMLIGKTWLAYLIPHCYPVFLALGMESMQETALQTNWQYAGLLDVHWYSLAYFVFFILLGWWQEQTREVR